MRIFISWSGERSRIVARALREFLATVLQAAEVVTSEHDIRAGERWATSVTQVIENADVGIACVTADNINNPWLGFEAGALASRAGFFIPLLVDLSPVDLPFPLAAFQAATLSRSDLQNLFGSLNRRLSSPVAKEVVDRLFERLWPDFERELETLPPLRHTDLLDVTRSSSVRRTDRELLEEVLEIVRKLLAKQPGENR